MKQYRPFSWIRRPSSIILKTYLQNGQNLNLIPITDTICETAGVLRGKYPHLKTVDAVQIATALDVKADVFLTNDKRLAAVQEIKMIILHDFSHDHL